MIVIEPDLSFTQCPEWIAEREERWKPIEAFLKEDNRLARVKTIKKYFMTGVCEDFELAKGGSIVLYCPLQTAEGWDWAFQNLKLLSPCYSRYWKSSLNNNFSDFFWDKEARLRFFDYFHPATYQPVIASRVPIGREQKVVEIELDVYELFGIMIAQMSGFVRKNERPILLTRMEYFFSCLDALGDLDDADRMSREQIEFFLIMFVNQYFNFTPKIEIPDPTEQKAFLARFYNHIANNPVHPSIKAIWQKVVDEHE